MNERMYLFMTCVVALCAFVCTPERIAGGAGEETTNGRICGTVTDSLVQPVKGAAVMLFKNQYDPVRDVTTIRTVTTDRAGRYDFSGIDSGSYNIVSFANDRSLGAMTSHFAVYNDTTQIDTMKLIRTGSLRVNLPSNADSSTGYVYIPGTGMYARATDNTGFVQIDSVPAGYLPSVVYKASKTSTASVIRFDIPVTPGQMSDVNNPDWLYARRIGLNTTSTGADVVGNVMNFPILIRLTEENFKFEHARQSGEDIMFTKKDNTPLPYEIERWDAAAQTAEIWVKMDTVHGNNDNQYIVMYWGNALVQSVSSGGAVFDTGSGFQGVWHLCENSNSLAKDATINHFDGTPSDTAPLQVHGVIGNALQFNGISNGLVMKNTANSRLNFPRPDTYTFSAWVSVDSVLEEDEFIAGKGQNQYALRVKGSKSIPANMFALHEYYDDPGAYVMNMRYDSIVMRQWKYITGIRTADKSYLFIDGKCVDSTGIVLSVSMADLNRTDFSIGRCAVPYNEDNYLSFKGMIDEVRIASVAFSADWVKLSFMNQKPMDMLLQFGK
jgi:hypothetical protein